MYTAQNIANIIRDGNLETYIGFERELIAKLEGAEIRYDESGPDSITYAHLFGYYDIDVDDSAYPHNAVAHTGGWAGSWPVEDFDGDQSRALAHAKAALRDALIEKGKEILAKARQRLETLEAARSE